MTRTKCVNIADSINFDLQTYMYKINKASYVTYAEARLHRWTCDKCNDTFQSLSSLRIHKGEHHSY